MIRKAMEEIGAKKREGEVEAKRVLDELERLRKVREGGTASGVDGTNGANEHAVDGGGEAGGGSGINGNGDAMDVDGHGPGPSEVQSSPVAA